MEGHLQVTTAENKTNSGSSKTCVSGLLAVSIEHLILHQPCQALIVTGIYNPADTPSMLPGPGPGLRRFVEEIGEGAGALGKDRRSYRIIGKWINSCKTL